ncbi:hypothetical protein C8J57DRAFT_1517080 [Mycena rebaudengoi]|nr:hypothetical protein C8J57DRAFT_1517080 [Mycena rebaudengoi]
MSGGTPRLPPPCTSTIPTAPLRARDSTIPAGTRPHPIPPLARAVLCPLRHRLVFIRQIRDTRADLMLRGDQTRSLRSRPSLRAQDQAHPRPRPGPVARFASRLAFPAIHETRYVPSPSSSNAATHSILCAVKRPPSCPRGGEARRSSHQRILFTHPERIRVVSHRAFPVTRETRVCARPFVRPPAPQTQRRDPQTTNPDPSTEHVVVPMAVLDQRTTTTTPLSPIPHMPHPNLYMRARTTFPFVPQRPAFRTMARCDHATPQAVIPTGRAETRVLHARSAGIRLACLRACALFDAPAARTMSVRPRGCSSAPITTSHTAGRDAPRCRALGSLACTGARAHYSSPLSLTSSRPTSEKWMEPPRCMHPRTASRS